MGKRILSLFLAMVMIIGMVPVQAFAADDSNAVINDVVIAEQNTENPNQDSKEKTSEDVEKETPKETEEQTSEETEEQTSEETEKETPEETDEQISEKTEEQTAEESEEQTSEETEAQTSEETEADTSGETEDETSEEIEEESAEESEENSSDECICQERCGQNQVNLLCVVCGQDTALCAANDTEEKQGMTAEELAELFKKLPDAGIFEYYVSQAEVDAIEADLNAAMGAYDALFENDYEEALRFEELYADLIVNALAVNDAITGYSRSSYATEGTFDVPYDTDGDVFTVTLGTGMDDAPPQVIRFSNNGPITYEAVRTGNRQYSFKDDTNSGEYIITGTAAGYADQQIIAAAYNSSAQLKLNTRTDTITVKLYYIYTNAIPTPYNGASTDKKYYGPSSDDTPMVQVSVDLAKLSKKSNVVYRHSNSSWYYIPQYNADGSVSLQNVNLFWDAVLESMTQSSREALRGTGLYDVFNAYLIKPVWGGPHGDGILDVVELPIYVAELHDNGSYFGSVIGTAGEPKNLTDVLALCNQNLGGTVYWQSQSSAESIGFYYDTDDHTVIKVTVKQTDTGTLVQAPNSDLKFVKKSDQHYLAQFNMTKQNVSDQFYYSVTYQDGADGTVFSDVSYPVMKGTQIPSYKEVPARTGYTFGGWTCQEDTTLQPGGTMPERDIVFEAVWNPEVYTVTWKNEDGTVLETDENVAYGAVPSYDGSTPGKAADAQYSYAFKGWTPAIDVVTKDAQYTAIYERFVNEYTVTWQNEDGTTLETDYHVPYNTMPSYDGAEPAKAADAQYTYTFAGWTPEVTAVTGHVVHKAVYTQEVNEYTVTWYDEDGITVLEQDQAVPYGTTPSYQGATPSKANTPEYTYTFIGWTPEIAPITGDTAYTANYNATRNAYTVTWKNHDGTVLKEDTVFYGDMPRYTGEVPQKDGDAQYSYIFSGWTPEVTAVTGNAAYQAVFTQKVNKYTVIWKYALNQQEVDADLPYGTALSFNDVENLSYEAGNYNYIFTGWRIGEETTVYTQEQINAMMVQADLVLTAQYNAQLKGHTVTVRVMLDAVSENDHMTGGTQVTIEQMLGAGTKLYLYNFGTKPIELVYDAANKNYSAQLVPNGKYSVYSTLDDTTPLSPYQILVDDGDIERSVYFYSVTYDLDGGTIGGSTQNVVQYHRGHVNVSVTDPQKAGSSFLGWQVEGTDIVLKQGDVITASIDRPYTLKALWGDAIVNLKVVVHHEYLDANGAKKGEDHAAAGELDIALAYRRNDSESFVEHVGSEEKSWKITYGEGATTTAEYKNIYTGLDNAYQYSLSVFLHGYEVTDRISEQDSNVNNVTVYLQYRPHMFTLQYQAEADESMAESLVPYAADVKIYSYKNDEWSPISAHVSSSTDVFFDQTADGESIARFGTGSYELPVHLDENTPYYYRIASAGLTLQDNTELNATAALTETGWTFSTDALAGRYPAGAYTAELIFEPVGNAIGVFANESDSRQQGTLKLLVKAHPAKLILNRNDGSASPVLEEIENIFVIPNLDNYRPTREGYTFRGWYKDAKCTEPAIAGDFLTLSETTTLYAKWNRDITVTGEVYVSGSYMLDGNKHFILPSGRLGHATVRLLNEQGLLVKAGTAQISYASDTADYGAGTYTITGVPDDGTHYTVSILQAAGSNYRDTYQNEPDSLDHPDTFESYDPDHNKALTGTAEPLVATVNAYLEFTPQNYDLEYTIDATAIGSDFRPDMGSTLVMYDKDSAEGIQWDVISQMIHGKDLVGQENVLTGGKGIWTYPVWKYHANGSLYNYAVKLHHLRYYPEGDGNAVTADDFDEQLPFTVTYDPLYTYYESGSNASRNLLTVVITPRSYPIQYVTSGGTMSQGTYSTDHTWSFDTALNAVPVREGYEFCGWYTDASLQEASKVTSISAKVAQATTVYAKWKPIVYHITYDLQGGTDQGNPETYTVETDTFSLKAPSRIGYTFLGWTGSNANTLEERVTVRKGTVGDLSFVAHWEQTMHRIQVTVENGTADSGSSISAVYGSDKTITFTADDGYALDSVTVDGNTATLTNGQYTFRNITADHSIRVVFAKDDNADGTPDQYQVTVTYRVVNGTLANHVPKQHLFSLKAYADGQWKDLNPTLGETIPTVEGKQLIPGEGYDGTGFWREKIAADTAVTADVTYTWEFSGKIVHTVTFPDADRVPNASGVYPDSITNRIIYGSMIQVDPNGGQWATDIFGSQQTFGAVHTFPLKKDIHLGTPVREHYVFKGWRDTLGENGIAHVYTAQWAPVEYRIQYVMPNSFMDSPNPERYTIESDTIILNNPRRAGYDFMGWSGTGVEGTSTQVTIPTGSHGDRIYTANWTARTDTKYQIRYFFQTLEGDDYQEDTARRINRTGTTGAMVQLGAAEIRNFAGFTFNAGRSQTRGIINGNGSLILYLFYDRNTYTVTWKNGDTVLETDENMPYGAQPVYNGSEPAKAATAQYTYAFTGWSPVVSTVTGDIIYSAQFSAAVNQYTITWLDFDAQILRKDVLNYGAMPDYGSTPVRESGAMYSYEFSGWSPEVRPVTANASYKAQYTAHTRYYGATASFYVNGKAATAQQMQAILGSKTLYIKADGSGQPYRQLQNTAANPNRYSTQLPVGNYKVYVCDGGQFSLISGAYLSIINQAAVLELHYNTVTYKPGFNEGNETVSYYPQGSQVTVAQALAREEWYFKGWLLGSNDLYKPGDKLTDSIHKAYVLTAQWSNTCVNLTLVLNHVFDGDQVSRDLNTSGTIAVDLSYKRKNEMVYVEVSDLAEITKVIPYTGDKTTVEFPGIYTGLNDDLNYSANVFLPGYTVSNKTVAFDSGANAYNVTVTLNYNPRLFTLHYDTKVDSAMAENLVPHATDIKIYSYQNSAWAPITAHRNYSTDVLFDSNGMGSGSYNVAVMKNANERLYYRVAAVGLALMDGTELNATVNTNDWTFSTEALPGQYPAGAYTAELSYVPDGTAVGVYGQLKAGTESEYQQKGSLTITVRANPARLKLDLNYEHAPEYHTVEDIFTIPDLNNYVPVRKGYTFLGWYTQTDCSEKAVSGTVLEAGENVTLYAKWLPNLTVSGDIAALNTFGGNQLVAGDRLTSLTVTLHKAGDERLQVSLPQTVQLVSGEDENTGKYEFTDIPNDGSKYYLVVSAPGYSAAYWNEELAASVYTGTNYHAVDKNGDFVAAVNVQLTFAPKNFDLQWEIHTEQLGSAFRPTNVPVYVMGDTDHSPGYAWEVITQMRNDANAEDSSKAAATPISIKTGTGSENYPVWQFSPHGHAYSYAIRIAAMAIDLNGNGIIETDENLAVSSHQNYRDVYQNLPFRVQYHYPAFYMASTGKQDTMLTATLIPNRYTVTLDANGGILTMADGESNPISHTWSHETTANFTVSREGYVFEGWADENGNLVTYADDKSVTVAAAVQQNVTLTAQWTQVEGISFSAENHVTTYNGKEQTFGGDTIRISTNLPEGFTFIGVSYEVKGTDAGEYQGAFTVASEGIRILNDQKEDVTEYFDVDKAVFTPGKLRIYPKLMSVRAENAEKTYDGNPYENFGCEVLGVVNEDNPGITVTYQGDAVSAVDKGEYTIIPEVTVSNINYYCVTANGTLTINPKAVTVSIEAEDKIYDQNDAAQATMKLEGIVGDDNVSAVAERIAFASNQVAFDKDGVVCDQTVTAYGVKLTGMDSSNYVLEHVAADEAKIEPRVLKLWLTPVSRQYDGTNVVAITAGSVEAPLHGDSINLQNYPAYGTMEDSDTGNGKLVAVPRYPDLHGPDALNYKLDCGVSTVDIDRREVSIRSATAEKTYDGEPLSASTVYIDEGSFVPGDISRLRATSILVGMIDQDTTVDNLIAYDMDAAVKKNYLITETIGTLTVYADKNQNQIPDGAENKYTVTYLAPPAHTSLEASVEHPALLTGLEIPAAPAVTADTGYQLGGWKLIEGIEGSEKTIGNTDLVYELTVMPVVYELTYVLEEDVVNGNNPAAYTFGKGVSRFEPASRPGYVFMGWYEDSDFVTSITDVSTTRHGDITLYPRWEKDVLSDPGVDPDPSSPGDGVPDIYQVRFIFRAGDNNGTVSGDTTQVITLEQGADGYYIFTIAPKPVMAQANTGYKLKNWTDGNSNICADPFAEIQVEGGKTYTFYANFEIDWKKVGFRNFEKLEEFVPQPDDVPVQSSKMIRVDPNEGIWRGTGDVQVITITQDEDLGIPVRSGYLFLGWLCKDGSGKQEDGTDIVWDFTAQWTADSQNDGIPDRYQKKVTFSIRNGVWGTSLLKTILTLGGTDEDIVVYLTLTDVNGNYSETGSADLRPHIPTNMQPNKGYHKGSWDTTPPDTVTGNESVRYIYSYQLKPTTTPKTGDDYIHLWISLMALSFAGIAGNLLYFKQKRKRK